MPKKPAPVAAPVDNSTASSVVLLNIFGGKLSPEQTRFNKLLARVDTLTRGIEAARAQGDAHRPTFMRLIPPLELRCRELMHEMIMFLDQRLKHESQKGFTAKDQQLAREIICSLTIVFARSGDVAMQAIFDAHSDQSFDEIDREQAAEMQAMFDDVLKGDTLKLDPSATAEEVMRAGAERMREREEARFEKRNARKTKRNQASRGENGGQTQHDPETVLRTLYRQLASKLHPDRERDPLERDRKNALMSQANAAYEKRDLMTLLKLQFMVEQLDSDSTVGMATEKMAALTQLLKEQVQTLEDELAQTQGQLAYEFGLPPFASFSAPSLERSLNDQRRDLQAEVSQMESDVARVTSDVAEFKRWLKEQRKLLKQARKMTFGML